MSNETGDLSKLQIKRLLFSKLSIARLATSMRDGKPHVVPVWFKYSKGKFYISTPSSTLKIRNLLRKPYASLVVDEYDGVLHAIGILVEGKTELIRGPRSQRLNLQIHNKYAGSTRVRSRKWKKFMAGDDATIIVRPLKMRTWDLNRLNLG